MGTNATTIQPDGDEEEALRAACTQGSWPRGYRHARSGDSVYGFHNSTVLMSVFTSCNGQVSV